MARNKVYSTIIALGLVLLLFGCSGHGSPVLPMQPANSPQAAHSPGSDHQLWGVWHISLDPVAMTVDVAPLRGSMFTCNVTRFMQPPSSPVNMVSWAVQGGSNPPSGYYVLSATLRHPFPGWNIYSGFDVRGIFMADGSVAGIHDPALLRAGPADSQVLNPDGYTRFWNASEFTTVETIFGYTKGKLAPKTNPTSIINPYKYFADGLGQDDPVEGLDPATRGFFKAGSVNSRTYVVQFKPGLSAPYDFNYAVDASWSLPNPSFAPEYPVEAYDISANLQEPFYVKAVNSGSTAYYVDSTNNGGEFKIGLEVFDRQGNVNPSGVPGEISSIWIESGELTGPIDVLGTATVLPGNSVISSIFQFDLTNVSLTSAGPAEFLATIESANPTTYEPSIPGGSAFAYPSAPLAGYFTFNANVSDVSPAKLAVIAPNGGEVIKISGNFDITWDSGGLPGTVNIEYSKDDFVSDIQTIATDVPNNGLYKWIKVPNDPSTTDKVRITLVQDPSVFDVSDNVFTLALMFPTDPVVIDADHPVVGTHFAIDQNGIIHALYHNDKDLYWSYSADYGNTWVNKGVIYTSQNGYYLYNTEVAMTSDPGHVYALISEWDGSGGSTYCSLTAGRLDTSNLDNAWDFKLVWAHTDGYSAEQSYSGLQIAVDNSGSILLYAMIYNFASFVSRYTYVTDWDSLTGVPEYTISPSNGNLVYYYPQATVELVADSQGNFFMTAGGNFQDSDNANGGGQDYGGFVLRYTPSEGTWRFVQTISHDGGSFYWNSWAAGLAVGADDQLYWVLGYQHDNCGYYGLQGGYFVLSYGVGLSTGDHDFSYNDPINDTHNNYVDCDLNYQYYGYDLMYVSSSIGVDPSGSVVITYQRSITNCHVYAIRNDHADWSDPPVEIDGGLLGQNPYGRMHQSGWFLVAFTDTNYLGEGSGHPYFVAWK